MKITAYLPGSDQPNPLYNLLTKAMQDWKEVKQALDGLSELYLNRRTRHSNICRSEGLGPEARPSLDATGSRAGDAEHA